jgi:hypothetical protein
MTNYCPKTSAQNRRSWGRRDHRRKDKTWRNRRMEFLTSIPAAFGTMAVMVAFFVILSR